MTIAQIADWFAPWQSLYESSKLVPAITQGVHLLALLIGGGLAVSADRATLRAYRAGPDRRGFQLAELGAVHRPVLIALGVMFASGLALATADVKTFAVAPLFWVKLGFVALLLTNGAVLARTEGWLRAHTAEGNAPLVERRWARLRTTSVLSMTLWCATLAAGVVLGNMA